MAKRTVIRRIRNLVARAAKAVIKKRIRKAPGKALDKLVQGGPRQALKAVVKKRPRKAVEKALVQAANRARPGRR